MKTAVVLKSAEEVKGVIKNSDGHFITVKFVKKDGSIRTMNCRIGVTKYLHGGEYKAGKTHPELIPVYDMVAKGYRSINTEKVLEIHANGQTYMTKY